MVFDSVWVGFHAATMRDGQYSPILNAAIGVRDKKIAWIGPAADLPAHRATLNDLGGGWVTPGLIDCHTHLIFAGNRSSEYELRLQGADYKTIAEAGGGIQSTVDQTRNASEEQLFTSAAKRLRSLMADGVTTVEIKSGYGLDVANELKMLRTARRLGAQLPITVKTSCLAAHALPVEFSDRPDDYIDYLCAQVLPQVANYQLADAVDGFCETIAFSTAQIERYFACAQHLGLAVKLHAEQLSAQGGASLAARYQALSADHLEYITEADIQALASAGTVAVLLPGAFYNLRETQLPPVHLLRQYGVPMAVATDANPGSAPVLSLRLMLNMACSLFGLLPQEALLAVTTHAAHALGLGLSHGQLKPGMAADFVCWEVQELVELCYWMGGNLLKQRVVAGSVCDYTSV